MPRITATTYSILALLDVRPWTPYEANQFIQFSAIRAVWPRTEARIYQEFKRIREMKFA